MSLSFDPGIRQGNSSAKQTGRSKASMQARSSSPTRVVRISVGDRQLEVEVRKANSLVALRTTLHRQLKVPSQDFNIFDSQGELVKSDTDLHTAIDRGDTPLHATVAEASLMHMEHRREELSQIQWNLVREQFNGLAEKIVNVGRSVEELGEFVADQRCTHSVAIKQLRQELKEIVNVERDAARTYELKVSEHIDAIAHGLHGERSSREALQQSLELQIQGIRDELECERRRRNASGSGDLAVFNELRHAIQSEGQVRQALEDRLRHDVRWIGERLDVLTEKHNEKIQDLTHEISQVLRKGEVHAQDVLKQNVQGQAGLEHWQHHMELRVALTESGNSNLETRLSDFVNRQAASFDGLWKRLEKLYGILEQVRLEERAQALSKSSPLRPQLEESTCWHTNDSGDISAVSPLLPTALAKSSSETSLKHLARVISRSPSSPVIHSGTHQASHMLANSAANCSVSVAFSQGKGGTSVEFGSAPKTSHIISHERASPNVGVAALRSPARQQVISAVVSPKAPITSER